MKERDEKSGAACLIVGVIGVMLPVLYVLGLGPAAYLGDRFPATYDFVRAIYEPLGFAGRNCQPIRTALDWYLSLWGY